VANIKAAKNTAIESKDDADDELEKDLEVAQNLGALKEIAFDVNLEPNFATILCESKNKFNNHNFFFQFLGHFT
jgi:hypothetical protein